MKQKIPISIVYVCAATVSLCLLKSFPASYRSSQLTLIATAFALLLASLLIFRWPRIGHSLGLISGLGILYWFYHVEFSYLFPAINTWVVFNLPDGMQDSSREILIAKLKIACAVTSLAVAALSATCLLPAHWIIRKRRVRDRFWPALTVCVSAVFFWYAISVRPYRIPWIVDAVSPKLALLHVEKDGSQFHETGISIFRDGKVYVSHNDRRLFQYRFPVHIGSTIVSQDDPMRKAAFALAEELANANTAPPVPLHSNHAEGWYARTPHRHLLSFTTEDGIPPPLKLLDVFHALESAAPATKQWGEEKDVCLGFC